MESKKIEKGDLVCMFRRKIKGLGIVLKVVDDLGAYAGFKSDLLLEERIQTRNIDERVNLCWWYEMEEAINQSKYPELARTFVNYNNWGMRRKLKKRFALVRWIQRPSDYQYPETPDKLFWIPADWLRSIK